MKKQRVLNFAVSYWVRDSFTPTDLCLVSQEGIHFLGLLSIPEILQYRPRTCDTSMPIKLALRNETIRDWAGKGYPHVHTKDLGFEGKDFFNATMTDKQLKLAKSNIEHLKEVINNGMGT